MFNLNKIGINCFFTSDPKTIELCERALNAQSYGGYIVRNNEPIAVINMLYSRIDGHVRVRVDYKIAIVPPEDMRATIQ